MSGWSSIKKGAGAAGASFKTIQTPSGTSPVATGPTDILTLASAGGSIAITGNAGTDTINLDLASGVGVPGGSGTNLQYRLTGSTFGGLPNSYVDATNSYLGLNVASPSVPLHAAGSQTTTPAPTGFSVSQVAELSNTASSVTTAITYGPDVSDNAAALTATQSNGSGSYFADGSTNINYSVYAVILFDGIYYYRGTAPTANFVDDNSANPFTVNLGWTAVGGATSYVIVASGSANNGNPNWSLNVGNVISYADDGAQSGSVTPSPWDGLAYPYDSGGTAPTVPSGTPVMTRINVGSGNKLSDNRTYAYDIDTAVQISGVWYVSGTPVTVSQNDGADSQFYDWQVDSWTLGGGSETSLIIRRTDNGGGSYDYFFATLGTNFTDGTFANDTLAAARWGITYPGVPATITRLYRAYGYGLSPTNNTQWFSSSFNGYSVVTNNSVNGYVITHSVTHGSRGNSRILGDYNAVGDYSAHYDTSASSFNEGVSNLWASGATITPAHYGILAAGQTRYWRLFAQKTSPSVFYSSSFLQGSSALPNNGLYYTLNVGWTPGVGAANTKILESTDGSSYTIGLLTGSSTLVRENAAPTFGDGTTVTPNAIDGTAVIAQNSSAALSDSPALVVRSTSATTPSPKIEWQNSLAGILAKAYVDPTTSALSYWSSAGIHDFHTQSAGKIATIATTEASFNRTNNASYIFKIHTAGGDQGFKLNGGSSQPKVWIGNSSTDNGSAFMIRNVADANNLYLWQSSGQTSPFIVGVDSNTTTKFQFTKDGFLLIGNPGVASGKLSINGDSNNPAIVLSNPGSITSSPISGAIEYDSSFFYGTFSGTRRKFTFGPLAGFTTNKIPKAIGNNQLGDSGITDDGSTMTFATATNTFSGTVNLSALTATRPLKINGSKNIITALIDLASANDVTGTLPRANGGTGQTTSPTKFTHLVDANNSGTAETDLYSATLAAGQLGTNSDILIAQYGGIFTGDATSTQRLRAYFGGTQVFDSGAIGVGVGTTFWDLYITIIRVSSSVVRCSATLNTSFASLSAYSVYTEVTGLTLANTQIIKITGTAAGVSGASNQITAKEGYVEYKAVN